MSLKVQQFEGKIASGLQRGDGAGLARLVRPSPPSDLSGALSLGLPSLANSTEWSSIEDLCQQRFTEPMDEVIVYHLRMLATITKKPIDFAEAYAHQAAVVAGFLRAFESMERWANPLLIALITNLQVLAAKADATRPSKAGGSAKSEDAARLLLKAFHACQVDRSSWENSRKSASLQVVNTLFKIYFRLKQHRLCQPLIRAIGNDRSSLDMFPASYRVTFKFYTGLLAFYDENFSKVHSFSFFFHFFFLLLNLCSRLRLRRIFLMHFITATKTV